MAETPDLKVNVVPQIDQDALAFVEGQLSEIAVNPFNVHVDVCELLRHFDGDEQAMFDLLGKLKDFLA